MLLVASLAFLLLLGPFYVHWCITYLFYNYPQCHFTRNLYENVQVCMGVFNPYLTVIEKGMRESNHTINFLLYIAMSTRFRSDFKRISRRLFYVIFGSTILFLYKHICFCCTEPSCLVTLQRNVSDTMHDNLVFKSYRKTQMVHKTSHYYSNFERRKRQNQLIPPTFLDDNKLKSTAAPVRLTSSVSFNLSPRDTTTTVRKLT